MFTGIITDVGELLRVEGKDERVLVLKTGYDVKSITIGSSIACSGVCLTVIEAKNDWFSVLVSSETLGCTNMEEWTKGRPINLERSLKVGDELGGHIVSGHVDGVIQVLNVDQDEESLRTRFYMPDWLREFVAPKGSIAIDGVSLTVNTVRQDNFEVNIIPYTQEVTTLGSLKRGTMVNLEIDVFARYLERALRSRGLIEE